MTLKVKRLQPSAKLPTVAYYGEDIAADLYSLDYYTIRPHETVACRTGISIEFDPPAGAVLAPRSSQGKASLGARFI